MNQENEANNLILELSADLEEEEQPSQKKKPTIVDQEEIREKETVEKGIYQFYGHS